MVLNAFGNSDETRLSRTLTRTAHLLLPVAAAVLAVRVVEAIHEPWIPEWMSSTAAIVMVITAMTALLHQQFARLCVRCMQEVPADASAQADRKLWLLRLDHRPVLAGGILLILFGGVPLAAAWLLGEAWSLVGEAPAWSFLPGDIFYFALIYALWAHHRLRPWCPYCRRWDDGHGPHEHTPAPDPAGVKQG